MRRQALSGILHGLRGGQPYRMTPRTGELYSLGVNAYLDDNYIHLHGRRTVNEVNCCGASGLTGSMPTARRPGG